MATVPALTNGERRVLHAIDRQSSIAMFQLETATLERKGMIEQVDGHFVLTENGRRVVLSDNTVPQSGSDENRDQFKGT